MTARRVIMSLVAILFMVAGDLAHGLNDPEKSLTKGTLAWGGLQRTYVYYAPRSLPSKPLALVLVLHGGGGMGANTSTFTVGGFEGLAEKEGFIVLYPDGLEKHWNDGRGIAEYRAQGENVDDVGFLAALIDDMVKRHGVDPRRVYMTGISNGALMIYRFACERADKVAAIAPVICSMSQKVAAGPKPSRPISVLIMSGTEDPLVPWNGGDIHFGRKKLGAVLSTEKTVDYWVRHNGCSPVPAVTDLPDRDPKDGTRVRRQVYGSGKYGTEVILYAILGGGHTWPGGYQYLPERMVGRVNRDIDASKVIWEFFKMKRL